MKPLSRNKNVKVRNATPTVIDGIKFRSKLEGSMYLALKENNISFMYEQERFILIPKFEYQGEKVRAMTYLPDFVGENFIIECKGNITDSFPLRWKIFKYTLMLQNKDYKLYIVRNMKDINNVINTIKNKDV